MRTKSMILAAALAAVGCGGGQKPGGGGTVATGGGNHPAPPSGPVAPDAGPKRTISQDTRAGYDGAIQAFLATDKANGWNQGSCRQSADRFSSVVHDHPELVEAQYMVGLSFQRCHLDNDAEHAYQQALKMKPNQPQSLSNLGEIAFRAGRVDDARKFWDQAVAANGKLIGARNNIASLELEQMRKLGGCACDKDPQWKKLEEDARLNLTNVLGVDNENTKAYTLYGLIYMEGWQKNKNRLDLAKLLLDEGEKHDANFAPLKNARGLLFMHKNNLSLALEQFQQAVKLDPNFVEARMNVGLTTLSFRNYDAAKEQFSAVIQLAPKNYDAYIGLGIALRGAGDLDGAEAQYKKAMQLDPKRGAAYFNLGVLYQGFRANKQADLRASQTSYRQARDFFKQFLDKDGSPEDKAEAKNNIGDCEKVIAQLDDFIKNQANQPPPPPAAAPAAAPPAK